MFGELKKENYLKYDKPLYDNTIKPYLAKSIFDFHIHVDNNTIFDKSKITKQRIKERFELSVPLSGFSFEKYSEIFKFLYGNIEPKGLFFTHPLKEINLIEGNEYIGTNIDNSKIFGLITALLPIQKTISNLIEKYSFIGFKPYPDLCDYKEETKIKYLIMFQKYVIYSK